MPLGQLRLALEADQDWLIDQDLAGNFLYIVAHTCKGVKAWLLTTYALEMIRFAPLKS